MERFRSLNNCEADAQEGSTKGIFRQEDLAVSKEERISRMFKLRNIVQDREPYILLRALG